jgi:hypothetical protein
MEELLTNKINAIKYALKQFFKNIIIALFFIGGAKYILKIENTYSIIVAVIIFIYIAFQSVKYYKDLKNFYNIKTHISEINKRDNPKGALKGMINTHTMMLERFKMKLDLLKSFSPIPIIVFISGIFINIDIKTGIIPWIAEPTISTKSIFALFMMLFIIWYSVSLITTWDKFKTLQFRNLQYQNEYDKL